MNDDDSRRARAIPEGVRLNRDARRLVEPINERVGDWQMESVRLLAAMQRMRHGGRDDPGLVSSVKVLLSYVEEQALHFEQAVAQSGADLAAHSRVSDTRRSLQIITDRLRGCLEGSAAY